MAATRVALSMDDRVLERARRISRQRGTSISKLFVAFVRNLDERNPMDELPPITRQALGLGRGKAKLPANWDYRAELGNALSDRFGGE